MTYSGFSSHQFSNPYAPAIPVGSLLDNRYRVLQVLGQGGFGRTYKAADTHRFDEICVLKEFAPQVNSESGLELARDLFQREAGVLYRLNHPQIPRFRELRQIESGGFSYVVLIQDFIEGRTYRDLLNQQRQNHSNANRSSQPNAPSPHNSSAQNGLSIDSVVFLLKQLLPVLAYLHRNGVIHRDISPGNLIQRQSDGQPVLIDFGAVKKMVATVISQVSGLPETAQGQSGRQKQSAIPVAPGTCIGKQGFAPPEQFQSGQAFPHSDLYALGATALTLLSGSEPGELINPHNLEWQFPPAVLEYPGLAAILQRMVALRPSDRYLSATQVLHDLENTPLENGPTPPKPPSQAPWQTVPGPELAQAHPLPPHSQPSPTREASQAMASPARAGGSTAAHRSPDLGSSLKPPAKLPNPNHEQQQRPTPSPKPSPDKPGASWGKRIGLTGLTCFILAGGSILGLGIWQGLQPAADDPSPGDTITQDTPAAAPDPQLPPAERARKQRIWEQQSALGVPETYLNQLVNDDFYRQHPELNGRKLSRYEADQSLRDEWDSLAFDWLETLKALPKAQRKKLGSYNNGVRDRWITQINKKRLGSRALNDLTNVHFRQVFPQLPLSDQTSGPQAQIWRAIAAETVESILQGDALQTLKLNENQTIHSGSISAHRGLAHVIELKKGQPLTLTLDSSAPLDMAFYPPHSNQAPLVPLSSSTVWDGTLETDGFYEVVLVATGNTAVDYTLMLEVTPPDITPGDSDSPGDDASQNSGQGDSNGDPDSPTDADASSDETGTDSGQTPGQTPGKETNNSSGIDLPGDSDNSPGAEGSDGNKPKAPVDEVPSSNNAIGDQLNNDSDTTLNGITMP